MKLVTLARLMSLNPKDMLTDDVQSRWILDLILRMNNLPPVLKAKLEQERPRLINHPRVLDVNDFFDFVIEEVAGETVHEREILKIPLQPECVDTSTELLPRRLKIKSRPR